MTVQVEKPPYRIPTMGEIRAVPHNGLNVVSTFAGAGGSSTGYRMAGYRVLAAVEFVPAAADSYEANCAEYTTVLRRDVRSVTAGDLLEAAGVGVGELDVLDGSPPCEPFSTAGRREATWNSIRDYSGERQRTDDLFFEYARLVGEMQPRCFVAENVTGLARGRARGYFKRIMAALRDCGYRVAARTLDASWLGVPQSRHRIIIIGVREDLGVDPVHPEPLGYQYTVRDAISDLLAGGSPMHGDFDRYRQPSDIGDEPAPAVLAKSPGHWHVDGVARMGSFEDKKRPPEITDAPAPTVVAGDASYWHVDETRFRYDTGGAHSKTEISRRDRMDEPSPTILNGHADFTHYQVEQVEQFDQQTVGNEAYKPQFGPLDGPHPTITATYGYSDDHRTSGELRSSATMVRRRFTIAELKRICGFPDDYVLTGSFSLQWERLGDAVPPPMAAAWARELAAGPLSMGDKQ